MIINRVLYDIDDFTIIPAVTSSIRHRSEVNPYYSIDDKQFLPIFVAPMECVISKDNFDIYENHNVIPILPRTESIELRLEYAKNNKWAAFGLEEFVNYFCNEEHLIVSNPDDKDIKLRVLIDNANGHMAELQDAIRKAKDMGMEYNYSIEIMAGNIAHPSTYLELAKAGADYVRCSVGNGTCCITASNTSTYYPMGSLIAECYENKQVNNLKCKIIADGGINSYRRAFKALALGADYVMIGSTFGSCFESASPIISIDSTKFHHRSSNDISEMRFDTKLSEENKKNIIATYTPKKAVWGMSTRRAQISIALAQGKKIEDITTKTSEGIEKIVDVKYTLNQWVENFTDYLRSSMSYCDFNNIYDYIGGPIMMRISEISKDAINK